MNQIEKASSWGARQHTAFQLIFLGGMSISLWHQWGPLSSVVWDANCVTAFSLAVIQLVLCAARFFALRAGWKPGPAAEGVFFAGNFAICLTEFSCGVPYYPWVFWVFLGYALVVLPRLLSYIIGGIATVLYVPMLIGWSRLPTLYFSNWLGEYYPLAFPWVLGLFYRGVLDSNEQRAKLIDELEAAKKALELARDREGELATLRERERLARDFHDTLGHQLVTLTVQLEAAQRLLAADPPRAAALLAEMQKLSRSTMDELRRSLDNLRMPGLGERPLAAALQALCANAGRQWGVAVECSLGAGADSLPPAIAEVLWRVAQEGLTNVGRHAQAQKVRLSLKLLPKEIILSVADDGIGLPPGAEDKPGHYGLRGIRERVEGLGGKLALAIPPGGGTILEAHLPIIS